MIERALERLDRGEAIATHARYVELSKYGSILGLVTVIYSHIRRSVTQFFSAVSETLESAVRSEPSTPQAR